MGVDSLDLPFLLEGSSDRHSSRTGAPFVNIELAERLARTSWLSPAEARPRGLVVSEATILYDVSST